MAEAIISGDGVLNDIRKDLAKDVKMDLARFIWKLLGVLILNCLRQWCFKRMLSWIVVRQKQLVKSRQCRCCETRFFGFSRQVDSKAGPHKAFGER